MRLAFGLEYDGTDWNGWQTQPDGRTIQDQFERALLEFTGRSHLTICAGRTDAGVHAKAQVVHIDTTIDRPDWNWVRGLNALLPESIAVRWAKQVPDDFHARFSALSRQYVYRIVHCAARAPLSMRYATWVYQPLDIPLMQATATLFVGEHDFSAFRSSQCQAATAVRTLTRCDVIKSGEMIEMRFKGNAFLHHMVRNLVGTMVEVGRGVQPMDWAAGVLASRDRSLAARTFPPQGLCLEAVEYDAQLLCAPESKSAD